MKDKIKLALTTKGALNQRELYEYICESLDEEATIITVYLTLRTMIKEGLVSKAGEEYSYNHSGSGLI